MAASKFDQPRPVRRNRLSGPAGNWPHPTRGGVLAAAALAVVIAATSPAPRPASADDESLDQRRARVAAMSAAEKEALRHNWQRFQQLDAARRQELRALQSAIAASPDRERLLVVMKLYHRWLQGLPASERLQLLQLPPDERVRAIKKLIERQERDQFQALVQKSLSVEDREAIVNWLSELALRQLPLAEQTRLRAIEHPLRRRMETMAAFRRNRGGAFDMRFLERLRPTAADRQELLQRLSPAAQETLAATSDDREKRLLVQGWVNAALFSRRGSRPVIDQQTLDAFYEQLDVSDQEYLNNLPPARMREELQQLYLRSRLRRSADPRPPLNRRRGTPN